MTQSTHITPEWHSVLNYYESLSSSEKKVEFMNTLTTDQQDYLLSLLPEQKESKISIPPNKNTLALYHPKKYHKKNNTALLVVASSVFGIVSFICTGLVINSANTIGFIKTISGFNSVLGAQYPQNKEAYYNDFNIWLQENNHSYNPDEDEDKDGLTNIDEYIWGSHITKADQNNNSILDGQDFLTKIDPLSGSALDTQDARIRLMTSSTHIHNRLFGYSWDSYLEYLKEKGLLKDKTTLYTVEYPTEDGQSTQTIDIDSTKPITLSIPSIGIVNEVITEQTADTSLVDILNKSQITRIQESAMIGEKGVAMLLIPNIDSKPISSLYTIADTISTLEPHTTLIITATTIDNTPINLEFDLIKNNLYDLNEINYSKQFTESHITLSTSHPIDSQEKRLFVSAKLMRVVKDNSIAIESEEIQQEN